MTADEPCESQQNRSQADSDDQQDEDRYEGLRHAVQVAEAGSMLPTAIQKSKFRMQKEFPITLLLNSEFSVPCQRERCAMAASSLSKISKIPPSFVSSSRALIRCDGLTRTIGRRRSSNL